MSWHIKVREAGKWHEVATFPESDILDALDEYNNLPVPRMLIGAGGIRHKQYTDNGFIYRPSWATGESDDH